METWFELILEFLAGMYEEVVEKTGVRLGISAFLPGLLTVTATPLFVLVFVEDLAGGVLSEGMVDFISVAVAFVAVILIVKWYINRLRYAFSDVCESKINLLKFDIAVLAVELVYFVSILEISSLCAPYDALSIIIATPVILYVLHRLFAAWLDRCFAKNKGGVKL